MAQGGSDKKDKKPKRKLRAAPTLREQTESANTNADQPAKKRRFWQIVLTPFRLLGRLLRNIGSGIKRSRFGKGAAKLYRSKLFIPVRFLVKGISTILFVRYFRESWQELKLVVWPDRWTTWRLTFAVIVFAVVFGALVAALDFGFERLFRDVILKA
jgi:preprotein translocase SecE subunit